MSQERRSSTRHPFYAWAEITETRSGYFVRARTNELSQGGCYIDMLNPLRSESALELRIVHGGESMVVPARVMHAQPNVGMGLRFDALDDARARLIERWLPGGEA